MKRLKAVFAFLLVLSTLLPLFSSCGECAHVWDEGYVAQEPTDTEVGYTVHFCTICNEPTSREIPMLPHTVHKYDKQGWGGDDSYHWLICDFKDCSVTTGKSQHSFFPSRVGDDTCGVCRHSSSKHTFTTNAAYDDECHWICCDEEGCPVVYSRYPHTIGADLKCTDCEYTMSTHDEHAYSKWNYDGEYHWLCCNYSGCSSTLEKSAHAWITENGQEICKDCRQHKQ